MVKRISFFLFDDLNYRIDYSSEGVDKKIIQVIMSLFLNYFVKGIRAGILYKRIDGKFLILKVEGEERENEYTIKFVYLDKLENYPIKLIYETGFIDNNFKHPDYDDLEFQTLSKYMKSIDAFNFRAVVSALFRAKYYNSAIRLRGSIKELLLWVAAIQTIFPEDLAKGISFKIEQYKNDIGMASISISDNIIDIRYRINIDVETESIEIYKFTSILEMQYLMPSKNLEAFFLFSTHFDYKELDERLEDIYNIYMISRVGIGDNDYTTLKLAIDNVEEIGSKEAKRIVVLNLLKVIDKLTMEMDLKTFRLVMSFMFRASNEMESLFINEMCKDLYLKAFISVLFEGRYKTLDALEEVVEELEKLMDKRDLYKYVLDDKRLDHISIYINIGKSPEKVLFVFKLLLKCNIELGYKWNKFSEKFMTVVKACTGIISKQVLDLNELLHSICEDEEYISSLLIAIYTDIESEDIQSNFNNQVVSFLMEVEDEKAIEIRKRLSYNETGLIILYEEFKIYVEKEKFDLEAFKNYLPSFYRCKEYFKKSFSRAVAFMLSKIEESNIYDFSMFIINEIRIDAFKEDILPDKTLSNIVLGIEQNVDFENCNEVYEILQEIMDIKKRRNIRTSINITELLRLQRLVQDDEEIDLMEFERSDMKPYKLTEEAYKKYRNLNLNKMVGMCSDKEEHKVIADAFMVEDNFIFDYMKIALSDDNIKKGVALSFIIYYLYYIHPVYKVSEKEDILLELRRMLIERIGELSFNDVCDIDDNVKNEFESQHLSMPVEWEEVFSAIKKIKSDGNLVNKLKFMMKK